MAKDILKVVEKEIQVITAEKITPSKYFKDRDGLYVGSGFLNNIVEKAEATDVAKEFNLVSYEISKLSSDKAIESALPKDHIFSETDVCAVVASLIDKQPKGEEGTLLNNGYANLFYTPSRVVVVRWSFGEWYVRGWFRDVCVWRDGSRVFSPATDL